MSITYVEDWPKQLGGTWNPTPQQCRAAGYELLSNRPAGEIAAEQAQQAARAAELASELAAHKAKVDTFRTKYRAATRAFCRETGITEVDVMAADQLETVLHGLLEDSDTNAKLKRNMKALGFALQLEFLTRLLEKEDGADALDRI